MRDSLARLRARLDAPATRGDWLAACAVLGLAILALLIVFGV